MFFQVFSEYILEHQTGISPKASKKIFTVNEEIKLCIFKGVSLYSLGTLMSVLQLRYKKGDGKLWVSTELTWKVVAGAQDSYKRTHSLWNLEITCGARTQI